jgi:hypothetical protein
MSISKACGCSRRPSTSQRNDRQNRPRFSFLLATRILQTGQRGPWAENRGVLTSEMRSLLEGGPGFPALPSRWQIAANLRVGCPAFFPSRYIQPSKSPNTILCCMSDWQLQITGWPQNATDLCRSSRCLFKRGSWLRLLGGPSKLIAYVAALEIRTLEILI